MVWTFRLRLRDERLGELSRQVAESAGISQNELFEQAIEHEVVARGGMLSLDLQAAEDRILTLTDEQYSQVCERSMIRFAEGEGRPDPLRARRFYGVTPHDAPQEGSQEET